MRTLAILLALLLVGCQAKNTLQPTDASYIAGGAIKAAFGHGESLRYNLDQAVAYISENAGRLFIDGAYKELGAMFVSMTEVMQEMQNDRANHNAQISKNIKLMNDLEHERAQWLGDRTHRLLGWIVGLGTAAVAGFTILHFVLGGSIAGLFPWTGIIRKFFPKKA